MTSSVADPQLPRVGAGRLLLRSTGLGARLVLIGLLVAATWPLDRVVLGSDRAKGRLTRRIVRRLEGFGACWVKIGQMLASRPDLFSPVVVSELGRIFDSTAPMSRRQLRRQWAAVVREVPRLSELSLTGELLGAGSVACVYRATDADGRPVAVKLQRPGVNRQMATDLALLRVLARGLARLPGAADAQFADLVGYVGRALYGQVDFTREGQHTKSLADNLADQPGVLVPRVRPELSGVQVLVTDLIPGLSRTGMRDLELADRRTGAVTALAAVGSMVFRDGFVHCDLHPGNLYIRRDSQVVILDAGYCVLVPEPVRQDLAEFFSCLRRGDGRRCGQIMLSSALGGGPTEGRTAFVEAVAELVRRTAGSDQMFQMSAFGQGIFELQTRYAVHPPSDFAFPIMSLLIVEGTLRTFWPDLELPEAAAVLD